MNTCLSGQSFQKDLEELINHWSAECPSNTPDFALAEFLVGCLDAWNVATKKRDRFYTKTDNAAFLP